MKIKKSKITPKILQKNQIILIQDMQLILERKYVKKQKKLQNYIKNIKKLHIVVLMQYMMMLRDIKPLELLMVLEIHIVMYVLHLVHVLTSMQGFHLLLELHMLTVI